MASQKFFIFSFLVALVSGGSQIDFDKDKSQNGVRSHFVTKGLIHITNPLGKTSKKKTADLVKIASFTLPPSPLLKE